MGIIFGTNSILIESYSVFDLNVQEKMQVDVRFEVRQRCFHLFWIPLFPIRKIYQLKQDGNRYDLELEYIEIVKSKGKHRTPWYSFLLSIMSIIGILSVIVYSEYHYYMRFTKDYQEYRSSVKNIAQRVSQIDSNSLITFNRAGWPSLQDDLYLKVKEVDNKTIKGYLFKDNRYNEWNEKYTLTKDYSFQLFYKKNRNRFEYDFNFVEINKADLTKVYFNTYSAFSDHKLRQQSGIKFDNLKDRYRITRIIHWDEPNLRIAGLATHRNNDTFLLIENHGQPIILKRMIDISGKELLKDKLPLTIPTSKNDYGGPTDFELKLPNISPIDPIELSITASVDNGKDIRYRIKAENDSGSIEKILKK